MKKPELLAPVGNFESLVAAISAGCDAVYLALKNYGARAYAGNFSHDDFIKAIKYAHLYDVKVYVTLNTLIYDDEINSFLKQVDFLVDNNVDALIIQDIGMFHLIHNLYPDLEIHISTQMHIHNIEGCKLVSKMGAKRVVLARETPIELVKQIKEQTDIELEVFVHGALCISYSGQCLMSSLIGGRSGNRGTCAQCCRQPYSLYDGSKQIVDEQYLLSTKDLNTLNYVGKLIDCGIDSFKIEGRMKRAEYVYLVVSLYRKAIDNYFQYHYCKITDEDLMELKKIFNRGFIKGFLFHEQNDKFTNTFRPNHLGIEIGTISKVLKNGFEIALTSDLKINDGIRIIGDNDVGLVVQKMYVANHLTKKASMKQKVFIPFKKKVMLHAKVVKTTDSLQISNLQAKIKNNPRKVSVKFKLETKINNNLKIKVTDLKNNSVEVISDYVVQESNNNPTTNEKIIKQLSKTGETVYNVIDIEVIGDKNIFIPVYKLNDIRRKALALLTDKRLLRKKIEKKKYECEPPDFKYKTNKNLYLTNLVSFNQELLNIYDEITVPKAIYNKLNNKLLCKKIPRVNEHLSKEDGYLLVGELGSIFKYAETNKIASDFSLNVTNSYTVCVLHCLGVEKITLSIEMNDYQIKKLVDSYHSRYHKHPNLEVIVKGYPEVMVMKYDLFHGKYNDQKKYYLKDKYNNYFPIRREDGLTYIYHYKKINKLDLDKYYDMGINNLRENSTF